MRNLIATIAAVALLFGAAACRPLFAEDEGTERVRALIQELGSEDISARQAAQSQLAAMGKGIESILREAAGAATDSEIKARLAVLLEECAWGDAVDGLRMRVAAPTEVQVGKEFVLKVLIQNVSDKERGFCDWVPYDVSLYTVQVVDKSTGATVRWADQMRDYDKHFVRTWPIPPGQTHEVSILLHEGAFTPALVAGRAIQVRVAYEMTAGTLGFDQGGWCGSMTSGPVEVSLAP